ncbi:MAG: PEP-CTERM sorting domain-containing protein [Aquabacterium sp.]|nr:PEP-CTERM sorting domain-containing protein [Aquabacterium sp.]
MHRGTAALRFAAVTALVAAAPAHAIIASVDSFLILKNNTVLFLDEFSNGTTPGQESGYAVLGNVPTGPEANSLLALNSANGSATRDALGRERQAVVVTRTTPNGAAGLTDADNINITGIFGLTTPTGPLFNAYGVRAAESGVPATPRVAQLHVEFNPVTAAPSIRFVLQDFPGGTITLLGAAALAPTAGADRIQLSLTRTVGDDNFYGSFAYGMNGSFGPAMRFATGGALFVNSDFVRGQMISVSAVPETGTLLMMGLGLAGIAALRRRQAKAA